MKKKYIVLIIFMLLSGSCLAVILLLINSFRQPDYLLASTVPADVLEGGILLNPYSSLSVPTQITKIGDDYFLVDCYHNQILTSTSLDAPLEEWYVMTDQINRGHTIAGDGVVYLAVLDCWPVPDEYAGMVQISRIQNYFYITVSTDIAGNAEYANFIRVQDLAQLADTSPEILYSDFTQGGTPYYISCFDGSYFLTQHCMIPGTGVWQFQITNDRLDNLQVLYP